MRIWILGSADEAGQTPGGVFSIDPENSSELPLTCPVPIAIKERNILKNMSKKLLSPIAFLSATAFIAGSLSAQTTYSDQQTFDDGLLSSYTENFSDFNPDDDNDFDTFENDSETYTDNVFSFTATTASADGNESPAQVDISDEGEPEQLVNSAIWYVQGDGYTGTALSVLDTEVRLRFTDFSTGVDSFGGRFFLTDGSGEFTGEDDVTAGTVDIVVTFSNNSEETYTVNSPSPGGAFEFFGVIAEQGLAITQVDLISNDPDLLPTAGFVTVGAAIPEPATVVFWSGLGVFALVVAWRRRKQTA